MIFPGPGSGLEGRTLNCTAPVHSSTPATRYGRAARRPSARGGSPPRSRDEAAEPELHVGSSAIPRWSFTGARRREQRRTQWIPQYRALRVQPQPLWGAARRDRALCDLRDRFDL